MNKSVHLGKYIINIFIKMLQNNYILIHLLLVIICLFLPLCSILFFGLLSIIFSSIFKAIEYLSKEIIWKYLKILFKFIWNEIIIPIWDKVIKKFSIKIWKLIKDSFKWCEKIFRKLFALGKKGVIKTIHAGEVVYKVGKEVVTEVFNIGNQIVSTGLTIVEAVWNVIKKVIINIYTTLGTIIIGYLDFYKSIASFISDIVDIFLNII